MTNLDTVGLHEFMQRRKTLFCYSGPLTEELLTTISNPVRHQLTENETPEAIANRVFGATTGADLEYDRQRKAALFTQGPLRELKLAGDMAERRAFLGLQGSEEAKALSRRQNKEALKRTLADRQGAMMGMFGRIAPVNVENLFV